MGSITHAFVSAVPDGADTSLVRPSNWNANHSLAGIAQTDTTNTYSLTQTFTVAPVFTDADGARDALKIGPRWCYESWADFGTGIANPNGGTEWVNSVGGTGATITPVVQGTTPANQVGVVELRLGTTATGRAAWSQNGGAVNTGIGVIRCIVTGCISSLSDGTDTYVMRLGCMNDFAAEPTRGAYFRYTHSVNSGKWQAVCREASVETAVDTGVTATATTDTSKFEVRSNAAGTEWTFYIAGALVATINTNVPTACGFMVAAIRSAGTAAKSAFRMDMIYARVDFTTPRW